MARVNFCGPWRLHGRVWFRPVKILEMSDVKAVRGGRKGPYVLLRGSIGYKQGPRIPDQVLSVDEARETLGFNNKED